MRRLLVIVLVFAAAYSGYWIWAREELSKQLDIALSVARSDGWGVLYDDATIEGYPSRLDTTVVAPDLTSPDGLWRWTAPFFQVLALTYKPNHVIAVWPNSQSLETPYGPAMLETVDMRASLRVGASDALPLQQSNMAVKDSAFTFDGQKTRVSDILIALQKDIGEGDYRMGLDVRTVKLPPLLAGLPDTVDHLSLDGTITLSAPLDRHAVSGANMPRLKKADVRKLYVQWGEAEMTATGPIRVDAEGKVVAELTVTLQNIGAILSTIRGAYASPTLFTLATLTRNGQAQFGLRLNGDEVFLNGVKVGRLGNILSQRQ